MVSILWLTRICGNYLFRNLKYAGETCKLNSNYSVQNRNTLSALNYIKISLQKGSIQTCSGNILCKMSNITLLHYCVWSKPLQIDALIKAACYPWPTSNYWVVYLQYFTIIISVNLILPLIKQFYIFRYITSFDCFVYIYKEHFNVCYSWYFCTFTENEVTVIFRMKNISEKSKCWAPSLILELVTHLQKRTFLCTTCIVPEFYQCVRKIRRVIITKLINEYST